MDSGKRTGESASKPSREGTASKSRRGGKRADVHVALLRGVNLGGKNRLPMKELRQLFEEAGCEGVDTYIQSGNVVFEAAPTLASRIPAAISEAILERFGFTVPVVTRSAVELEAIVGANPFVGEGVDEKTLHVAFLTDRPRTAEVAALDPDRSPPDEFEVHGREIYLRCPNGMARTKLTNAYFDSKLDTISTMRNWRTTRKLLELTSKAR